MCAQTARRSGKKVNLPSVFCPSCCRVCSASAQLTNYSLRACACVCVCACANGGARLINHTDARAQEALLHNRLFARETPKRAERIRCLNTATAITFAGMHRRTRTGIVLRCEHNFHNVVGERNTAYSPFI